MFWFCLFDCREIFISCLRICIFEFVITALDLHQGLSFSHSVSLACKILGPPLFALSSMLVLWNRVCSFAFGFELTEVMELYSVLLTTQTTFGSSAAVWFQVAKGLAICALSCRSYRVELRHSYTSTSDILSVAKAITLDPASLTWRLSLVEIQCCMPIGLKHFLNMTTSVLIITSHVCNYFKVTLVYMRL